MPGNARHDDGGTDMDTIWGPALDAEVAYRQEVVRAAVRGNDLGWRWRRRRRHR